MALAILAGLTAAGLAHPPGHPARHLARRGDQHPPGQPLVPRHVREPAVRRPPSAAPPHGALADRAGLRRRRAGRPAAVADRGHARDPRAVPAGTRALRPPHRPRGGHLRHRLPAADLVRPGGADVRLRDPLRAARAVDAAAGDPRRGRGELGGLHARHVGPAVVPLLRPAADRGAAADLRGRADPAAARAGGRDARSPWASPTPPPCSPSSSCPCWCSPSSSSTRPRRGAGSPSGTYDDLSFYAVVSNMAWALWGYHPTASPSCWPRCGRCSCSSRCCCSAVAVRARP